MTRDQVLNLLVRRDDAFARRDVVALSALYAESAIVESPMGGSTTGREAIGHVLGAFFKAFPDVTIASEPPIIDGDRVAIIATVSGTQMGGFMGLPPGGKPFRFALASFFTLRDTHVVHERRIYDFTGLLVQVGVLKAKPA